MITAQQALAMYDLGCARGEIANGKPERLEAAQKLILTIQSRLDGREPWPPESLEDRRRYKDILNGGLPKAPGVLGP